MSDMTNLDMLVEPREKTYFGVALVIAVIVWLVCIVLISPIIIFGILALFMWLGNGLLIANIKAEAVKVDAKQMPALANTFARVCEKLQVREIPQLYIIQAGGLMNAFATRHSGRNFVVVYADLLETYGAESAEIEFLMGHEIGHIKRNHLLKQLALAPGLLFPLIGNAYSRACEMSCDRHGAFAASNPQGAVRAMMVLAGGKQAATTMDPVAFAEQYQNYRGFFVSWHELISGYPTLSQRVANLLAFGAGRVLPRASRNPASYFFAFFSPGGRVAGGTNILITIAIIGVLAGIAIPAFMKAREMSQRNACINTMRQLAIVKEKVTLERRYTDGQTIPVPYLSAMAGQDIQKLNCLKGGAYSINKVGEDVECSVHGSLTEAEESVTQARASRSRE